MSRRMHDRSMIWRLFSASVVLVLLISFTGIGYAAPAPGHDRNDPLAEDPAAPGAPPVDEVEVPEEEPAEDPPVPVEDPVVPVEEPAEDPPVPVEDPVVPVEEPPVEPVEKVAPASTEVIATVTPTVITYTPTDRGELPTTGEGNPTCPWHEEYKIDPPGTGTYTDGLPDGASITISNPVYNDEMEMIGFDFDAVGITIYGVFVKAADFYNLYDYHPDGVSDDGGLQSVIKDTPGAEGWYGISHITFCYEVTYELEGYKFYDKNGNGVWDDDEVGLEGWEIFLVGMTDDQDPVALSTLTDENGYYSFTGLLAGEYTISEGPQDFWTQTFPADGDYDVIVGPEMEPMSYDFGNTEDAVKTFELTFVGPVPDGTTILVTFEADATLVELELEEVEPGVYAASYDVMPGTVITSVEWWAVYLAELIKLGDGAVEETVNGPVENTFTYNADVFGSKWNDTNVDPTLPGDGVWDAATEPGLPDWTIELYRLAPDESWVLYDTTTTGADGSYGFDGLLPGTYYVQEVIPLGPTGQPIMTQSAGPTGDGDGAFEVVDETSEGPIDFGNYELIAPFTPEPEPEPEEEEPLLPFTEDEDEPFLPFTGGDALGLLGLALAATIAGAALRRYAGTRA